MDYMNCKKLQYYKMQCIMGLEWTNHVLVPLNTPNPPNTLTLQLHDQLQEMEVLLRMYVWAANFKWQQASFKMSLTTKGETRPNTLIIEYTLIRYQLCIHILGIFAYIVGWHDIDMPNVYSCQIIHQLLILLEWKIYW